MTRAPLRILWVTHAAPSPPRFGAARRMHGLMTALARRNELTAVSLADPDEAPAVESALAGYCRAGVVIRRTRALSVAARRAWQVRALLSPHSFERALFGEPRLLREAAALLARGGFDVVNLESSFVFRAGLLRTARRAGAALVIDEHNVEYDILRQVARGPAGPLRRLHSAVEWRKVRREEREAWRACDGVVLTSAPDEARVREEVPAARTAVVPNGVDVDYFRPRPGDPRPDGCTVLFFGAVGYFPNADGILHFAREIWPALAARRPGLRLEIVGPNPPAEVLALRGPRIEVTGFVDDLRPRLAAAAVVVVPLRLGGGTRLKILEAMAMARPVVSTALGAEGIDVTGGQDILLADEPNAFAAAVERVLAEPALAAALGRRGRALVEQRYSWDAAGRRLEAFLHEFAARPAAAGVAPAPARRPGGVG